MLICYHPVNVISFGLAQSDHIKRLLLYLVLATMMKNAQSINSSKEREIKLQYYFKVLANMNLIFKCLKPAISGFFICPYSAYYKKIHLFLDKYHKDRLKLILSVSVIIFETVYLVCKCIIEQSIRKMMPSKVWHHL